MPRRHHHRKRRSHRPPEPEPERLRPVELEVVYEDASTGAIRSFSPRPEVRTWEQPGPAEAYIDRLKLEVLSDTLCADGWRRIVASAGEY